MSSLFVSPFQMSLPVITPTKTLKPRNSHHWDANHMNSVTFYSTIKSRDFHRTHKFHCYNNRHFTVHSLDVVGNTAHGVSDAQDHSAQPEGSTEMKNSQQGKSMTTSKILEQLRRYGLSGILSYGLLNTAYYLTAFLVVWFYVAPVPGKMGYLAAVGRFLKVMAMVWAGSQVTKLMRAAGALALAPFVDKGLSWFTARFKFESRGKAFFTVVEFCLGLAVILFLAVTLLWA